MTIADAAYRHSPSRRPVRQRGAAFAAKLAAGLPMLLTVLIAAGLGWYAMDSATLALLGAAAALAIGAAAADMVLPALLAIPSTLLLLRISGGAAGLSMSDFVLLLGTVSGLLLLRGAGSPELRRLLWVVLAYQAALVPSLIENPYRANFVEWAHEAFLVGGSIIVGYVVARAGRASAAATLYLIGCCAIAVWACIESPLGGFDPVYLPTLHKNVIGDMLAFALILAYARPVWLKWTKSWATVAIVLCGLGILASQAKQGIAGAAAGVLVVMIRGRYIGRRSKVILLGVLPLLAFAYRVTNAQFNSSDQFNAVHQRFSFYSQSFEVWRHGRWFGAGLRWWYTSQFQFNFQPPNAELEMLTSTGVIGLAAFILTALAALGMLRRMDPVYGTVALAVLLARYVQGQLDLFWVAAQSSLPWMVVGLTTGAMVLAREHQVDEPIEPRRQIGDNCSPGVGGLAQRVGHIPLRAPAHQI